MRDDEQPTEIVIHCPGACYRCLSHNHGYWLIIHSVQESLTGFWIQVDVWEVDADFDDFFNRMLENLEFYSMEFVY